jgi:hypothetical protein
MPATMKVHYDGETVRLPNGSKVSVGEEFSLGRGTLVFEESASGHKLVRLSAKGSVNYARRLKRVGDYELGAHYARFIKPISEVKDPLHKVMRKSGFWMSALEGFKDLDQVTLRSGGLCCEHVPNSANWHRWEVVAPNGTAYRVLEQGFIAHANHPIAEHRSCKITPDIVRVSGTIVVAQFEWRLEKDGNLARRLFKMYYYEGAPRKDIAREILDMFQS